jgi:hypothetical protein
MRHNLAILLLALLTASCASPKIFTIYDPPAPPHPARLFPADALITQRAVLTVHGRQFTLNGYVAKSETCGLRLIVTESLGAVLADVLVKPGGETFVLKANPPLRPAWVERFIAADLKCIFVDSAETNCPLQMPSSTHFVIERREYRLDLRTVEVKAGLQPAAMFNETQGGKR